MSFNDSNLSVCKLPTSTVYTVFYTILLYRSPFTLTSIVYIYVVLIHSYLDLCVLGICCVIS